MYPVTDRAQSAPTRRIRAAVGGEDACRAVDDLRALQHHQVGEHEDGDRPGDPGRHAAQYARRGGGQAVDEGIDPVLVALDPLQDVGALQQSPDRPPPGAGLVDQLGELSGKSGCLVGQRDDEGRDEPGEREQHRQEDQEGRQRRPPSIRRCTQAAGGWRAAAKKAATTIHVSTRRVSMTRYSARAAARTRPMLARMVRTGTRGRVWPAGREVTARPVPTLGA
jgi:hypothetical protein